MLTHGKQALQNGIKLFHEFFKKCGSVARHTARKVELGSVAVWLPH